MTKSRLVPIMLASAALVAAILLIPASAGAIKSCGGGVQASGVSCDKAKRIAVEFKKTRKSSIQGYHCSGSTKSGHLTGKCSAQGKLIKFTF